MADSKDKRPTRHLTSVIEWLDWMVLQMDAILGKWELQVKVEDSDLISAGNQPLYLEVPNLAEAQKVLITKTIEATVQNELIINLLGRVLYELANTRQTQIEEASIVQAIRDYMGIPTTEKREEVPFSVTFQAGFDGKKKPYFRQLSLEEFLNIGTIVVRTSIFEEEPQNLAVDATEKLAQGVRGVFK